LISRAKLGKNVTVHPGATVGYVYSDDCGDAVIGDNSVIRSGTIIYGNVETGSHFQTGHNVLIRERSRLGSHVLIGTGTVIDGNVEVGDFVKIESNCYIPTHVTIGSRVFIGPGVALTNDKYPLKMRDHYKPDGPVIQDLVTVGAGVVVLPGLTIGTGAFVAAGAVVTKNVPQYTLVKGNPARFYDLPEELRENNVALSWRQFIDE
jgi:acetyltransferase-like isoleucine patch superfamily enzyme